MPSFTPVDADKSDAPCSDCRIPAYCTSAGCGFATYREKANRISRPHIPSLAYDRRKSKCERHPEQPPVQGDSGWFPAIPKSRSHLTVSTYSVNERNLQPFNVAR